MSTATPLPERLRFAEFTMDRLPNGRCRARVGLTWRDSEQFTGEGEGLASQAGELRCAAQACVVALGQGNDDDGRIAIRPSSSFPWRCMVREADSGW